MPSQIKYIIGNEGCERFSFYGMRAILTVFMADFLLMSQEIAKARYHYFVSAVYLTPLLGAYLADRYWGKYRTIMYLSIVYCIGHGVLAFFGESQNGLFAGLALIALGSGGIKPCVSANVGDQFTTANKHLVSKVFDLFYWIINFGSLTSTLLIPWVLRKWGPGWAFGIPGILMAIATLIFWLGREQYVMVPPAGATSHGFWTIVTEAFMRIGLRKRGEHWLDTVRDRHPDHAVAGVKATLRIVGVFATVSIFWSLFDQHGSSWVLQAKEMDLTVLGHTFEASQTSSLNPLLVLLLIPFMATVVYPTVERMGIKVTPLRKMATGMFVAAFSFVAVAWIQAALDGGNRLNVAWQLVPYAFLTGAEVLISITGLEFAYTQAPRSMKSTIMSFWLITVTIGNLIAGVVSELNQFNGPLFFYFFAGLMAAVAVVFAIVAMRYTVVEYLEIGEKIGGGKTLEG